MILFFFLSILHCSWQFLASASLTRLQKNTEVDYIEYFAENVRLVKIMVSISRSKSEPVKCIYHHIMNGTQPLQHGKSLC